MTNEYWLNLALPRHYGATRARATRPSHRLFQPLSRNQTQGRRPRCSVGQNYGVKEHERKKQNEQSPDRDLFLGNSGSPAPQNSLLYHEACIP